MDRAFEVTIKRPEGEDVHIRIGHSEAVAWNAETAHELGRLIAMALDDLVEADVEHAKPRRAVLSRPR